MRVGWLILVVAVVAGGAIAAVPRPSVKTVVRTAVDGLPVEDPFPIRRVRGNDSRLPELLKELESGPIVRLPRAEFESRVRAAGRAVAATRNTARVVDAVYFAELDGAELIGTSEIGILNSHGATGIMPLDPLRLAVRSAKWADGGEAILAVPTGASAPAVWMDRNGRRVLHLDWSLAGTTEPGERRFELRVPPCPTSALELLLPAKQIPTASSDVLLTGPFAAPGKPALRLWRLRFGGRSKVEFAVRADGMAGSIAEAKLSAKYELTSGQLTAAFEYELHPARGSVSEWAFVADPGLRITDVVANNRAGWTVDPPATPNGPRRVRVSLRQPGPGGKVLISAVAPFPDANRPTDSLPTIRPLNAVLTDEKLQIRVASGLKVDAWNPGDYRLTESVSLAGILPGTTDSFRVLSLVGTLLAPGTDVDFRRMPSLRTVPAEVDFTTIERLEWKLDPAKSVLVASVDVRVRRGALFQLAVYLPPGFVLDRSTIGPEELVSYVSPPVAGVQLVEFARPLLIGQHATLRLDCRGPGVLPGTPQTFPAFMVSGAAERDGWLSLTAAPEWKVVPQAGAGAIPGGLWAWLTTDAPADARAVYVFRGKEPEGTATLLAATPAVAADALVLVDTRGAKWTATTRFTLTTAAGAVPALAAFVPGFDSENRTWKILDHTNAVTDAIPVPRELLNWVPMLAPFDLRSSLAGAGAAERANGTLWVLRFARPLAGTVTIETTASGPAQSDKAVLLPVPHLLGTKQTIRTEPAPALQNRAELAVSGDWVRVQKIARSSIGPPPVSDAYLVTIVRQSNDVLAAFGGTVRDSHGEPIRLTLPQGAEVRGVCVAGRWLTPASCVRCEADSMLRVPLPAAPMVRFEVRYRLSVATSWPTNRVDSPMPSVLGGELPVTRWWGFAAGTLPGWPARPWDATTDQPPLLGGPLVSGEPLAFIARSDDEWVRVGTARTADALAAALAAGMVVLGLWVTRRRQARGSTLLGMAAALAFLTVEVGPPWWARVAWPPLIAATGMLAVALAALARRRAVDSAVMAGANASLLFVLFSSFTAFAQPPAPATVLIVAGDEGREEVVAARVLLDRLDALARPTVPAAVVTSAEYDVRADESGAHVSAKLIVYTFRSSDNAVSLPLGDARLERVTVNGKVAFPTAVRPDTYTVALPAAGRHEVELRFAATVTTTGPERELRFGVPEVPRTKLTASLPGAARQPQVVGRLGRLAITPGGERTTLEADVGAVKMIHLRWREGAGGAGVVKVREGCVWDITEAGANLTAAYLVRVEQGTVAGLRFDVPSELEVLRVVARALDAPVVPIPLRDWMLAAEKGRSRQLRVDFQNPTAGRILVVVECAPRNPITRQPLLRFPHVNFGNVTGETEAVYGLRGSHVVIDGVGLGGVIDFPPDALKDFASVPDLRLDPNNPVRVFRPVQGGTAELRPTLHVGDLLAAKTTTTWHAGPHRADATGTVAWTAKEPLPLLEFTLPGAKVLEVRGADVVGWNQSGAKVQVWLRGVREGTIEWTATLTPAPAGKPIPDSVRFDPFHPHVLNARVVADEVRVRAIAGWTVKVDRSRGWRMTSPTRGELRFRTELPAAPELRVQLIDH